MKFKDIEPLSDDAFDAIKTHYEGKEGFHIVDRLSTGDKERYFLISRGRYVGEEQTSSIEYTFIWIGGGLWQFRYINTQCVDKKTWVQPLQLLNQLVKDI